jgi:hypothetical protein
MEETCLRGEEMIGGGKEIDFSAILSVTLGNLGEDLGDTVAAGISDWRCCTTSWGLLPATEEFFTSFGKNFGTGWLILCNSRGLAMSLRVSRIRFATTALAADAGTVVRVLSTVVLMGELPATSRCRIRFLRFELALTICARFCMDIGVAFEVQDGLAKDEELQLPPKDFLSFTLVSELIKESTTCDWENDEIELTLKDGVYTPETLLVKLSELDGRGNDASRNETCWRLAGGRIWSLKIQIRHKKVTYKVNTFLDHEALQIYCHVLIVVHCYFHLFGRLQMTRYSP